MDLWTYLSKKKEPDWIFLLMKVSAKICSTELIQNKLYLLRGVICNDFLEHLKTYILSTPKENNPKRQDNMNTFYEDCLVVFQSITTLFPKEEKSKEILISCIIALTCIKRYYDHIKINETTVVKISDLLQNPQQF